VLIDPLVMVWYRFYSGLRLVGSLPLERVAFTPPVKRAAPVVRHAPVAPAVRPSRPILALVPSTRRSGWRS
jgi:hypothetical protein